MRLFFITVILILLNITPAVAQSLNQSQQFRQATRMIRIAEPGQLTDSVSVWGDISSGMYLVPRGTSLLELITYGTGPNIFNDTQTRLDWSKLRVEVYVNEYNMEEKKFDLTEFTYRFEEPLPLEMETFELKNNQTVILRVKRKPAFRDYISVIAPAVSAVASVISTYLLIERL